MAGPRAVRVRPAAMVAWALAAVLVQAAPPWLLRAEALRPDALLALALALAVAEEPRRALVCAFFCGLAADLLSCGPLGLNAALNAVLAYAALYARSILFVATPFGVAAFGLSAAALKNLAGEGFARFAAGAWAPPQIGAGFVARSLATAAATVALGALLGGLGGWRAGQGGR